MAGAAAVSPRGGSRRPRNRPAGTPDRIGRAPPARCRSGRSRARLLRAAAPRRRSAAIISGTTRGSRTSGTEQVAGPGVDRHRGDQRPGRGEAEVGEHQDEAERRERRGRVEEEEREDRHRDRPRARAGRRAARPPWRRTATVRSIGARRIASKPPSLALGDEQPVDPEDRREQERRPAGPRRRGCPQRLVRSRPKRKMTKVVIANSAIAGSERRVRSSDPQVLGEDRARRRRASGSSPGAPVGRAPGRARGRARPRDPRSSGCPPWPRTSARSASGSARSASWVTSDPGAARRRAEQQPAPAAALEVEVGVGLVEQQQLRARAGRAADRQPLAASPRRASRPGRRRGAPSRRRPAATRSAARPRPASSPCRRAWKRRFSRPLRSR